MLPRAVLKDVLQWDVRSWRRALACWDQLAGVQGARVLDLGARDGGLSLYFALKGCRVVCSDLAGPTPAAEALHRRYRVDDRVTYASIDATEIAYPDGSFGVVAFKSVLGGIGKAGGYERQRQAIGEMYRVLRPGGLLLFAENLRASLLHAWLRRSFVRWGESWRYPTRQEMIELLAAFQHVEVGCWGFFAAFGRSELQRSALHLIDRVVDPLLGPDSKYILYGWARK